MQAQTSLKLLPLFTITAAGMLTVDLYLPAVPTLPVELGGTIVEAQATLAVFFAALAASQLVWGRGRRQIRRQTRADRRDHAANRRGPRLRDRPPASKR